MAAVGTDGHLLGVEGFYDLKLHILSFYGQSAHLLQDACRAQTVQHHQLSRLALARPFTACRGPRGAPRELHDVLHADEFLHRPGACAERTVHLRHILLGDAGD